jgi:hypothetical protein
MSHSLLIRTSLFFFCALFLVAACREKEPVVLVGDPFPRITLETLEG